MPIGYAIDPGRRVVFLRMWGAISDGGLVALAPALRADPRFDPGFSVVADLRSVTDLAVNPGFVARGGIVSAFGREARRAVLVSGPVVFGMARMYQLSSDLGAETLRIFDDLAAVLEWLGLERDTPWPADFPQREIEA